MATGLRYTQSPITFLSTVLSDFKVNINQLSNIEVKIVVYSTNGAQITSDKFTVETLCVVPGLSMITAQYQYEIPMKFSSSMT